MNTHVPATIAIRAASLLLGLVLGITAEASLLTIQVDFNDAGSDPGPTWYVVDRTENGTVADLPDINGNPTGISMVLGTGWSNTGANNQRGAYDEAAADDYFYRTSTTSSALTFTFNDGAHQTPWRVELWSSETRDLGDVDFTINGEFGPGNSPTNGSAFNAFQDGYSQGIIMVWDAVQITDIGGAIVLGVDELYGNYALLNAMRLTQIPEPASFGMLALAGFALLARRKRG